MHIHTHTHTHTHTVPIENVTIHRKEFTMVEKVLSKDLQDKVVERHKLGEGYKNISKALAIPRSTVQSIIKKWKAYGTTSTLPRSDDRARRTLIREATRRPKATLKDLQGFMAGSGQSVHVATISPSFTQSWPVWQGATKKSLS